MVRAEFGKSSMSSQSGHRGAIRLWLYVVAAFIVLELFIENELRGLIEHGARPSRPSLSRNGLGRGGARCWKASAFRSPEVLNDMGIGHA